MGESLRLATHWPENYPRVRNKWGQININLIDQIIVDLTPFICLCLNEPSIEQACNIHLGQAVSCTLNNSYLSIYQ
jgi:hypothetical protein